MAFTGRFLVPMLAGLALAAAGPAVGARVEAATWTVGGVERTFRVATPDGWDGQTPLPLVLALHPFGSNGDAFLRSSGWLEVSDRHRVMVVSPDGSRRAGASGFNWNSYTFDGSGPDDLGFLAALPAEVARRWSVASTRVYVTGFSNGAMMASTLACARPRLFAAYAPVSGGWLSAYGGSEAPCTPDAPVDIWLWRGERESQVTGTSNPQPRNVQDAAQRDFWVAHNGGGMPVSVTETITIDGRSVTHRTQRWSSAAETWFTEVAGASHQYFPGAAERIWSEFFVGRQLDASTPPTTADPGLEYAWSLFGNGVARGVALAANGDVWVAGSYAGSLALGGRQINSRGASDAFVARIDANGQVLALTGLGGAASDVATDIVVSDDGRIFVTGGFTGGLGEGIPTLPAFGRMDTFVAEIDASGAIVSATSMGGTGDDYGNEVDARAGRVAIAVNATSGISVPPLGALPYSGGDEGYVVVLDDRLRPLSSHQVGGAGAASVRAVAIGEGMVAFAGECVGDLQMLGASLRCDDATDGYVAGLAMASGEAWVRFADGTGLQSVRGVGIDGSGNVTALGRFDAAARLDAAVHLTSFGSKDLMVWRLDSRGRTLGALPVGSAGNDEGGELVVFPNGVFSIAGHFRGAPVLKRLDSPPHHQGGADEVVLSFSGRGDLIGISRGGGAGDEIHYAMAESTRGNVTVGTYYGDTRFGSRASNGEGFYVSFRKFVPMIAPRAAGGGPVPTDASPAPPVTTGATPRATRSDAARTARRDPTR